MLLVIVATFCGLSTSTWHVEIAQRGWGFWIGQHLLSFRGLDDLIHADTMLFILGLTLMVSVIAQTRLLEGITFLLLRRYDGRILPTVIAVTAVVAVVSGILGGVSMIGLTIRTLVIILMLAAAPVAAVRYAVMVCTAVTTICGVWFAYGEPPNLIMKANLSPYLTNAFFLFYCGPIGVASYLVVAWQLRGKLGRQRVNLDEMDVIDANVEDVRFLQASRHGEVLDSGRARRGFRGRAGRPGRRRPRAAAQRRAARPRPRPRRRGSGGAPAAARTLRQRRARRRSRSPLSARRGRELRGGVHGRTGRRRSAGVHGAGPATRAEDRGVRARAVHRDAHRARHLRGRAAVSGLVCRIRRRAAGHLAHPENAPPRRCARRCSSTPSTTSCSRSSCRLRC